MDSSDEMAQEISSEASEQYSEDEYEEDFEVHEFDEEENVKLGQVDVQASGTHYSADFEYESVGSPKKLDAMMEKKVKVEAVKEVSKEEVRPVVAARSATSSKVMQELAKVRDEKEYLMAKGSVLEGKLSYLQSRNAQVEVIRKERLYARKKRADERRWEHEKEMRNLKVTIEQLEQRCEMYTEKVQHFEKLQMNVNAIRKPLELKVDSLTSQVSEFNDKMKDMVQQLCVVSAEREAALEGKRELKMKMDDALAKANVDFQVCKLQCENQVTFLQQELEKERIAWKLERDTLPDSFELRVSLERERCDALVKQAQREIQTIQATHLQEKEAWLKDKSLMEENETFWTRKNSQERHELELKIIQERETLDAERRNVLSTASNQMACFQQEREKIDQSRREIELERLDLTKDIANFQARRTLFEDKCSAFLHQERALESQKAQVIEISQNTMATSERLALEMQDYESMKQELATLRKEYTEMETIYQSNAQSQTNKLENAEKIKAAYEHLSNQLHHEKLSITKERMQFRKLLQQVEQYERLVGQKVAMGQNTKTPSAWIPVRRPNNQQYEFTGSNAQKLHKWLLQENQK